MFSASDADLARRDTALPGLSLLLDPYALAEELARSLPECEMEGLRAVYVRYKPHTNCLAAYRLDVPGGQIDIYAKAVTRADWGKLAKDADRPAVSALGPMRSNPGRIFLPGASTAVYIFPNDKQLPSLALLGDADDRQSLMRRVFSDRPDLWSATVRRIGYKPERRFVGQALVGRRPRAVVKFYTETAYSAAKLSAKRFNSRGLLRLAERVGQSDRHNVLAFTWQEGRLLTEVLSSPHPDINCLSAVGAALAELHSQRSKRLAHLSREEEADALRAITSWLGFVYPPVRERVESLGMSLAGQLAQQPELTDTIHGDFYARQVLLGDQTVSILDLDEAARGDPAADLGMFAAHLEFDALVGRIPSAVVAPAREALLDGYAAGGGQKAAAERVNLYTAAGLLKLTPHPFRTRQPDWAEQTEAITGRIEEIVRDAGLQARNATPRGHPETRNRETAIEAGAQCSPAIPSDPKMPFLAQALDRDEAERQLRRHLRGWGTKADRMRLLAVRLVRHKPGRRCLIEYDLEVEGRNGRAERVTLVGKVRARGLDNTTYKLTRMLWDSGFGVDAEDRIQVPEPVGVIPEFQMWLQRKVEGVTATRLLPGPGGVELMSRVAEAVHKLHRANAPTQRTHTLTDELRILEDYLSLAADANPQWADRIGRLFEACRGLAASVSGSEMTGIHRDFYPDQVIVDGQTLYLVDLDLYCKGDPALDIGNFIGHITELSLRTLGGAQALADREAALRERYLELSGCHPHSIQVYTLLTLARHVHISTQFPERRVFTEALIELCEQKAVEWEPSAV